MYYFLSTNLAPDERAERKQLFGKFAEGFRSLRPYVWPGLPRPLLEIPVTTMPLLKLPIHVSYLLYLGQFSQRLASLYFRTALNLCRLQRVEPSLLLHPLDFLGCDDDQDLAFFPAMGMPSERKLALVGRAIDQLTARFHIVTMRDHAASVREQLRQPAPVVNATAATTGA
jgi:hypothetical protein